MFGIVSVPKLVEWLTVKSFVKVVKRGVKVSGDTKLDDFLEPGDLIGYFDTKRDRFGHSALYLGKDKIACHTYCRSDQPGCTWDNDWHLGSKDWSITFFKITF